VTTVCLHGRPLSWVPFLSLILRTAIVGFLAGDLSAQWTGRRANLTTVGVCATKGCLPLPFSHGSEPDELAPKVAKGVT